MLLIFMFAVRSYESELVFDDEIQLFLIEVSAYINYRFIYLIGTVPYWYLVIKLTHNNDVMIFGIKYYQVFCVFF